jgi:hypothetical protein
MSSLSPSSKPASANTSSQSGITAASEQAANVNSHLNTNNNNSHISNNHHHHHHHHNHHNQNNHSLHNHNHHNHNHYHNHNHSNDNQSGKVAVKTKSTSNTSSTMNKDENDYKENEDESGADENEMNRSANKRMRLSNSVDNSVNSINPVMATTTTTTTYSTKVYMQVDENNPMSGAPGEIISVEEVYKITTIKEKSGESLHEEEKNDFRSNKEEVHFILIRVYEFINIHMNMQIHIICNANNICLL